LIKTYPKFKIYVNKGSGQLASMLFYAKLGWFVMMKIF